MATNRGEASALMVAGLCAFAIGRVKYRREHSQDDREPIEIESEVL